MLACSSLFRVDILRNSYLKLKSFQFPLQVCYVHSSLHFKTIAGRISCRQEFMENKSNKKIPLVWRPISSGGATSLQENEAQDGYKKSETEVGDVNVASDYKTFQGIDKDILSGSKFVPSGNKHSVPLEIGASLMRFIKGKGGSAQKQIEEETGVKLIFSSSRNEDAIVIEGPSADCITKASERIHSLVDEVVKSPNLDYSHFVSLPLALHVELVEKLVNFQTSILENNLVDDKNLASDSTSDTSDDKGEGNVAVMIEVEDESENVQASTNKIQRVSYAPKVQKHSALSDTGIEKSIFIRPETFHLTVLMLKLWNKDRVAAAAKVLQSVSSKVIEALDSRPISIRLKGLKCMKGSFAKARVVYAPVEESGSEGRLERACQVIIDAFVEAGLVLEKDAQTKLKLHATVMNARHRKRNPKTNYKDSFDARNIFKQYGSEEWGEYLVPEVHLSQRFAFDKNGYYHRCSSIPLPKNVQVD